MNRGFALLRPKKRPRRRAAASSYAPPPEAETYLPRGAVAHPGHEVELLEGGAQAYPEMLDAIRRATSRIHFSTYILRSDAVGKRFAEALKERAAAGLTVRLLYDWLGSIGVAADYLQDLAASGVKVVAFRPPGGKPRWFRLHRRMHQKILVVDDREAFTGGLNVGDEYAPEHEGGEGWHDFHARIVGPSAVELEQFFRKSWVRAGGDRYPKVPRTAPATAEGAWMCALDNGRFGARSNMRRAWLAALRAARTRVSILNSYFIPDRGLRRAMAAAVRRGVKVEVIVPGQNDVVIVKLASRHLYGWLLRRGIRLFEWGGRMMHAKAGAVDGTWFTVGSFNIDRRSFFHNVEAAVVGIDGAVAETLHERFAVNTAKCSEIVFEEWKKRAWIEKILGWLAFQMRAWL